MIYRKIADWCLYLMAFFIPIFFLPWTLDPLEINKQTLLVILVLITCLAMAGANFIENNFSIKKSFVNSFLIVFLVFSALSAAFSGSNFLSWAGASSQEYTSFVSILAFAVLFWLISGRAKDKNNFSRLILFLSGGAIISGLIGLSQIFGFFLPFSFAQTKAFNTVGTINSLGIFLAIATILINSFFIVWKGKGKLVSIATFTLSIITFVFLAIINFKTAWLVFLIGLLLILIMVFWRAHELHHTKKNLLPMLMAAGAVLFLIIKIQLPISFPAEVLPNMSTSWSIATQTLTGTNLWFGSGPGTYSFEYAKFRPVEVNTTNFWNTRFSNGSSGFLTILPTLGILPTFVLLIFSLILIIIAIKSFAKHEEDQWLAFTVIPAWLTTAAAFFIYPTNFTLAFVFFFLSGLLGILIKGKIKTFSLIKSPRIKIIASLGFTALAIITVTVFFLTIERFGAEYAFAQAVKNDRGGGNLPEIIKQIDRAASINRFNDVYYRNLAEALLSEVKVELSNLGTNQPTVEQNTYIQNLIAASINAGKQATVLEPRNVTNWLELGSIYRSFASMMPEAGDFALTAFQTVISLEPNNPDNYLELGKTFLAKAAALEPLTVSTDAAEKQTAQTKRAEAFAAAEAAFNKAIELKSDYANAHYQLALTFEREGKLNEAIGKMESISNYNPQDVGAAFELGILYLRRLGEGDLARAEKSLKQAVELLPSYSNAHWYLAYVYEQEDQKELAIAEIEKVLELNPDNEMVKTRLNNLKNGNPTPETTTEPIE